MYVVLAWFADRSQPTQAVAEGRLRVDAALSSLIPESYVRHDSGGDDWGLSVLHAPDLGAWRWQVFAEGDGVTAVSLGVPVGLKRNGTLAPVPLARRLLAGEDLHAEVVPPFGLVAVENNRRFGIQQDWLGMCRIFTGNAGGVTVFSSRPGLVARFLGQSVIPDDDGWASYAACGHFGGASSPVRGVRLLEPGLRVIGRRRDTGGWDLTDEARFSLDDLISAGVAARADGLDAALDLAADGLAATASSVDSLYEAPIKLGLSGGRDSRLIAASLVSRGRLPSFHTNGDIAAEAEVAQELMDILRDKRGLQPSHSVYHAGRETIVLSLGLRERLLRYHALYDYQFPSTYTVRHPGPGRLPAQVPPASFSGAGGELATGYWYPKVNSAGAGHPEANGSNREGRSRAEAAALGSLLPASIAWAVPDAVKSGEVAHIRSLFDRGEALGLRGYELVDLVYLMERVRRWYSSAYHVGTVTPFLAPGFVSATFAVSPEHKRNRLFHGALLQRLLPEWEGVRYVTGSSAAPTTAARITDGDGVEVLHDLLDTVHGRLANLLRRDAVAAAFVECAGGVGTRKSERLLQHFAYLAVASEQLEPEGVRPAAASFAAFMRKNANGRRPRSVLPAPLTSMAARLTFLKRSRLGRWAWTGTRAAVIRFRWRVLARAAQRPTSLLPGRWRNRFRAR